MDSWGLQGDSYSLRSAPRTFSLHQRDGTPNHVEIFDITNIPSNRSTISETTCLCDIFGDDGEPPSLPGSPASGSFVSSQRELEGRAATSPLVDDSSGSYHTAHGSSEGEEGFEEGDPTDRLQSPTLQNGEQGQPESHRVSPEHPGISKDIKSSLKPEGASPSPQLNTGSPLPEVLGSTTEERTPSPRYNSHPAPEGRASSLSSSSLDTRSSLSSPNPRQSHLEAELQGTTPTPRKPESSSSHPSLTESPSPEPPRHTAHGSSSEPITATTSSDSCDFGDAEARNSSPYCDGSPSPEPPHTGYTTGPTPATFEARVILRSPSPSLCSAEIYCRETLSSAELNNSSCSPKAHASPAFPEIKGRVSLPDLLSRSSTPDTHVEASASTPEPILSLSATEEDATGTPENQGSGFVAEPASGVSTPVPIYTSPPLVTPLAPTPELRERSVSPEVRCVVISHDVLSTTSPIDTCARTPSPALSTNITETFTPSAYKQHVLTPPSLEVRNNYSPVERRYTAVSPEIKITASRDRSRKSSDENVSLNSLDCHSISPYSRSLTASPHITSVSYSVVQPEDRDSSPYPELCRLCTPESGRTHLSPEPRSPTPSRYTPHIKVSPCATPEVDIHNHQPPSPGPQCHIPTPEPGHQTPLSERHRSPSELSPLALSTEHTVSQLPPVSPSTEANSERTLSCYKGITEVEECVSSPDITGIQYRSHPADDIEITSSEFKREVNTFGAELENSSPVAQSPRHSPKPCTSPLSSKEEQISSGQQSAYREITAEEVHNQNPSCEIPKANTISAFTEAEEQGVSGALVLKQVTDNTSPVLKTPSPNLSVSLKRIANNSPAIKDTDISPIPKVENPKPTFTAHSPNHKCGESDIALKPDCTPGSQPPPKLGSETIQRLTETMAHRMNRKQRTSPPLTRFTPVHIIAPEKPYRNWQNRDHSPPQVATSPPSGNVKNPLLNKESPRAALHDSNSQAQWHMREWDLEIEREEVRETERVMAGQMEIGRGRKREERMHKREERRHGASYRGEQVELSFSARNRKGPRSHSTTPTSREAHEGMPTSRSYSDSLLATRQLQQQQILPRAQTCQQDTRAVGPRRLRRSAPQGKSTAPGRTFTNRPRQSSSSSMGSELDDADNEVKWFTDVAFSSLSSPEVDYLDMYNSSHRSSTNMSQPSTQESPAGANAAWLAYADFKGSAPRLDNEDLLIQQPSTHYSDELDPSRHYEVGSFECVDVAMEREDHRKAKRGVPKRQIQLKRRNTSESKQDGGSGNSSPVMADSPLLGRGSKETLIRQHSTPAAMERCHRFEPSPEPIKMSERRCKLQKAASLDETCTKNKMATCLIKSVLSKKMQSTDKQTEDQERQEACTAMEDITAPSAPSQTVEAARSLEHSSEDHTVASQRGDIRPQQNLGVKPSNSPSPNSSHTNFTSSHTNSHVTYSHNRTTVTGATEKRSELIVPFNRTQQTESVIPKCEGKQTNTTNVWEERKSCYSTKATAVNMGAGFAIGDGNSTPDPMRNRHQECRNADTEDHKQFQQIDKSNYMSKTSELTFKTSSASVEKKKTSLNVSLTPEVERKSELHQEEISPRQNDGIEATDEKTEEEEIRNGNNKAKGPIHKVRDVRRLVKNTYNLSFKASSASLASPGNEENHQNKDDDDDDDDDEKKEEIKVEWEKESMEKNTEAVEALAREGKAEGVNNEEPTEERKEEWMAEAKNTKLQTVSPSMQKKGKPLSHPQPMQIECKAVCWKEDKNQMTPRKPSDKSHTAPQLSVEADREPENSCYESSPCYTTGDTATTKPCQGNMNTEAEPRHIEQQTRAVNENKPEVVSKDSTALMLGSLPKLPSKEKEVSTAVVVIQDEYSVNNTSHVPDKIKSPIQPPPSPGCRSSTPHDGSGHSVSMLLKEKGYQADIGAVVGEAQSSAGVKVLPCKHVNRLEIPVQCCTSPDGGVTESQRKRTFSSSSSKPGPTAPSDTTDTVSKNKPTVQDKPKQMSISPVRNTQQQPSSENEQKEQGQFEAVKRSDPTFPPRSPALRRFRPQPIEVKSLSKETPKQETTTNNKPQAIEVKSVANNSQKPVVPPKPNYKFNPDTGSLPNQAYKSTEPIARVKPHSEHRPQTIVVSSPTIYRKLSSDSTASNYTRKLAVSAVSSYRPPQNKTTTAAVSSLSNQSTASTETETSNDRAHQPGDIPKSSRNTQRSTSLVTDTRSATGPAPTSAPVPAPGPTENHGSASGAASQPVSQAAALEGNGQPQYPRQDQAVPVAPHSIQQPAAVLAPLAPGYVHANKPYRRSLSNELSRRADDVRFYASDDPPSYDERESFSPLLLPDLPPRKPNCYHPSSRPPPCSCTSGCPAHPHHHRSPHNRTPPAPSHSPGQGQPPLQPPLRPRQCRADPQPLSYQPSSPKLKAVGPGQPSGMYQPLSQPPSYPPHPALLQPCPAERPLQPHQRPPVHRSPQQQPPGVAGVPYGDHSHGHSPGLQPLEPQYLCGPQGLGSSYGSEYGGDSASLYSESSYGQTPRRVLLDPETGKYFYIEVPVQPLRKMLFDPETGQYVEVLIPQQAMSHSGLYPPSAAPYQPLHNPNMYVPPSQYMPYVAPQHPPHHQAQAQPPRHTEASAPASVHQNGPAGVSYGNPSGQGPKLDVQTHPPLDRSYLESMYYVPTGMNASPNPTPSDCFHKHPATLPNAGGKRS